VEAILHVAIYAGVPAANHATSVTRAAYAEIGIEV
jgi:alkylhydroperoxidase/carboxymuconolactone decarboxylase family protein YurZ